jgi:methylglyoxal reductase
MQYRKLGMSGIEASVVGMGTWVTGGGAIWGEDPDDSESIRAIHTAIDNGVNLIDTAPAYGFGRSEEVIGKAVKDRRDKAVIATKCGLWWDDDRGSWFMFYEGKDVYRSIRPDTIRIEIDRSLKRLQTDYIDLYQTHWPAMEPDRTPIADTMECLMDLKKQGKIRAIGCSNVSLEELKENCEQGDLSSDQLRYSMICRDPEKDILPFCEKNNIATLTYMSLEQGLLTGKIGMDRDFGEDEFRSNPDWNPWFAKSNRARILDLLKGWNDLKDKYNCSLAQLVIAWTAVQPGVTHVLSGARKPRQIEENAAASEMKIEDADLKRIRDDVEALGEPAPVE